MALNHFQMNLETQKKYRLGQLDGLPKGQDLSAIKIIKGKGMTEWMRVTEEELDVIRKILL